MLLSEGFGWYTFQPPSSAVSTTLVGHYYSGVYSCPCFHDTVGIGSLSGYRLDTATANK